MAFNYRPKTKKEITDLKFPQIKEKELCALFYFMQNEFKNSEEYFTMDLKQPGKIKVLREFESKIDIKALRKEFRSLSMSIGNGLAPSSTGPTTQQQELCTLIIFEQILSKSTPSVKTFNQLIPILQEVYPELNEKDSWYKSFLIQFTDVKKKTGLPPNRFKVYNRDGGFMDWITELVKKFGIAKKDSWDPADIWLLKDNAKESTIKKKINACKTLPEVNDLLRKAFRDKEIVGISLKKNNGKELKYELVNVANNFKMPVIKVDKYNINVTFDDKTKSFLRVSSRLDIKTPKGIAYLGVKSNQAGLGNITYEFVEKGAAAQLGKVPKDMMQMALKEYGFTVPGHMEFSTFTKPDILKWKNKIRSIKKAKFFNITGDIDTFVSNLEKSFSKGKKKDNSCICQIIQFAYILSTLSGPKLNKLMTDFYYMAQKKGESFGPFGKLY